MPKRFENENDIHFLTFSTYKRLRIFTEDDLCKLFVNHLESARERRKFELYAFVVMPNHIHMLIKPDINATVGKVLGSLKKTFSLEALEYISEVNPVWYGRLKVVTRGIEKRRFWQVGGGYDRNIISEKTLKKAVDYIHLNPVRRGMVKKPLDYKWSSAEFWIDGSDELMRMDDLIVF